MFGVETVIAVAIGCCIINLCTNILDVETMLVIIITAAVGCSVINLISIDADTILVIIIVSAAGCYVLNMIQFVLSCRDILGFK